jgi:predicted restriction endonuclease
VIQGFSVLSDSKSQAVLALVDLQSASSSGEKELEQLRGTTLALEAFDPSSETEGRKKILASICQRQGQPEFRRKLIAAYGGRCAITASDALQTLEAAHIIAYDGPKTNHPANGILLRADLHILFDLGLLTVNPHTYEVRVSPALMNSSYAEYNGLKLYTPLEPTLCPNKEALAAHQQKCGY